MKMTLDSVPNVEFVVGDFTFAIDPFEVADRLSAIDDQHRKDGQWATDPLPDWQAVVDAYLPPDVKCSRFQARQFHDFCVEIRNKIQDDLKKKRAEIAGLLDSTPVCPATSINGQSR